MPLFLDVLDSVGSATTDAVADEVIPVTEGE